MTEPTLILTCSNVITMDPRQPRASAVAIAGDRIAAVGGPDDIRDWRGNQTEIVDLGETTLTPGLTDSHMHPAHGLGMTAGIDLSRCTDLASVRGALAGVGRADEWVLGWGLDPNAFGAIPIGSAAIDDVL